MVKTKKPEEMVKKHEPETRVYGVYGLIEWQALIRVGEQNVSVPFTGGALTGFGVRPATFSTDNEILARHIEESRHFRTGRIRRVR